MRRLIIIYLFLFITIIQFSIANAQTKKAIDFEGIDNWTYVGNSKISSDGNYASYIIENRPTGYQTLIICSTIKNWRREIVCNGSHFGGACYFTNDSKYCICSPRDSIAIIKLGTSQINYIPDVDNFKLLEGSLPYFVYQDKNNPKKIIIYDLLNNREDSNIFCDTYLLSPDGIHVLYHINGKSDSTQLSEVILYNISDQSKKVIWKGSEASNFKFDYSGHKVAFMGKAVNNIQNEIFFYKTGDMTAKKIESPKDFNSNFDFTDLIGFSNNDSLLYFKVQKRKINLQTLTEKPKLHIWGFNDPTLNPAQPSTQENIEFLFVARLRDHKLYNLCRYKFRGMSLQIAKNRDDAKIDNTKFLYFSNAGGDINESYWNKASLDTISIISSMNGRRTIVDVNVTPQMARSYKLSPNGKWILYYNSKENAYFSYNVSSGQRNNLTSKIKETWYYSEYKVQSNQEPLLKGVVGWVDSTNDVILQGQYDIWRISLDGEKEPLCVTKGYGRSHHIEFMLPKSIGRGKVIFNKNQIIYLSAFNPLNKRNGFFSTNINGKHSPTLLSMGDYAYYVPWTSHSWGQIEPVKAAKVNSWIVGRQATNESLNYYFTKDFRHFKPISNNHPERNYNWMHAELIKWKMPDGNISQGILYKPEDFDSTKKYPLIFQYYEELSNNLNVYLRPERVVADINIPYYVSNGYLVFTPDIERTKNGAGVDALNAMTSAAKYLVSEYSFIDVKSLGLSGHSMGGYKTNFIVTHSDLFAAANINAGPSNISSFAFSLWSGGGGAPLSIVERGQFYIGYPIGERPDLYVTNSPIFYVSNVKTPLLMLYNKKDDIDNWRQGVALFKALRREGKRGWMLQYDGSGHMLDSRDTAATTDWTIRQKQFFDHYLMGKPAPVWMTKGIPAWEKGIGNGYKLDTKIVTPKEWLLTTKEIEIHTSIQHRKPLTATFP
ncbi:alpha/beta hydrolase family protein [Arachidicoccus terrestris]|uniref:alpha/beta hydrolase family protein n=1 Tax=Arachidicoccus terrestris TaxID=2875539 RepID=UPI001CC4EFE2|nr:prolyl oligopeptidase family serine peptidase [Arachidicoccus terrestris]UAY55756.1 prolyl oligopeptidase family serine peptidase [Arachidicoccus terrestris]